MLTFKTNETRFCFEILDNIWNQCLNSWLIADFVLCEISNLQTLPAEISKTDTFRLAFSLRLHGNIHFFLSSWWVWRVMWHLSVFISLTSRFLCMNYVAVSIKRSFIRQDRVLSPVNRFTRDTPSCLFRVSVPLQRGKQLKFMALKCL